ADVVKAPVAKDKDKADVVKDKSTNVVKDKADVVKAVVSKDKDKANVVKAPVSNDKEKVDVNEEAVDLEYLNEVRAVVVRFPTMVVRKDPVDKDNDFN
nr:hypothetical protein [Tanacetum cinerariifolium]